MKVVAYCRVSTSKDEQLDSLEAQQTFFNEYSKRNGYNLIKVYADEGKSGTKMRNRTELLRLLSDANNHSFDVVLIKDVSRLARNTLDFLTSIRKLKSLGIKVVFVNYDQTSSDSSEFMLTMLSAIAQEESANISKRVKFGKKINAEKGRVPNFVYGYDKIPGDYFNLKLNESEANIVQQIFNMYAEKNMGENKIALELNRRNIKTKRGCNWSQNAISRILSNELYTGKIINGKESCPNKTVLDEKELLNEIKNYFISLIENKSSTIKNIINEFNKKYKEKSENKLNQKEILKQLQKLKKSKQKYLEMFENDIINMSELKEKTFELNKSIAKFEERLELIKININKSDMLKNNIKETFKDIEDLINHEEISNRLLTRLIEKITVDENGKVDVYLKLLNDINLDKTVHLVDNYTYSCNLIERFCYNIK